MQIVISISSYFYLVHFHFSSCAPLAALMVLNNKINIITTDDGDKKTLEFIKIVIVSTYIFMASPYDATQLN